MVKISPVDDLASHPIPANAAANGRSSQPPASNPAPAAPLFDDHWTSSGNVAAGTTTAGTSQPPLPPSYGPAHATMFNFAASENVAAATAGFNFNISSSAPMYSGYTMNNFFVPSTMADPQPSYYGYGYPPCIAPGTFVQGVMQPPVLVPMQTTRAEPQFYSQTQSQGAAASAAEAQIVHAFPDTEKAQAASTPTPRRRGRPRKNAAATAATKPAAFKPKRAAGRRSNQAASQQAASATAIFGQVQVPLSLPDQATSAVEVQVQHPDQAALLATSSQTAPCTNPMALLCQEQWQPQPICSAGAQAVAVVGQDVMPPYADTSPEGVRFQPTDEELIFYLRLKYAGREMPVGFFKDFDVYQAYPEKSRDACEVVNGFWYAFSPRDRKYKNGSRPKRSVVEPGGQHLGYWKSNTKLASVRSRADGSQIGSAASLTFHLGHQPNGAQTPWKMREYTIPKNQHAPDGSAMRLNDWVLCKLFYKKHVVSAKKKDRLLEAAENDSGAAGGEGEDEDTQMGSSVDQTLEDSEQDLCVEDYLVE